MTWESADDVCPFRGLKISQDFDFHALYLKSPINCALIALNYKRSPIFITCSTEAQGIIYFKQGTFQEKVAIYQGKLEPHLDRGHRVGADSTPQKEKW